MKGLRLAVKLKDPAVEMPRGISAPLQDSGQAHTPQQGGQQLHLQPVPSPVKWRSQNPLSFPVPQV